MANISRLLALSSSYLRARNLAGHISRRYVQEFPETRFDNSISRDYLLVLPEKIDTTGNDILRIPQQGEPEVNFGSLDVEKCFKGLSQTICSFENYKTDVDNQISLPYKNINELIRDVEKNLYPMDFAYNIMAVLINIDSKRFNYKEISELMKRYHEARLLRTKGAFKQALSTHLHDTNLTDCDKRMLKIFKVRPNTTSSGSRPFHEASLEALETNLIADLRLFHHNLNVANNSFSHTIDEPDILAAVVPEFDECQELHHRERTPLEITAGSYHRFMKLCPDRFIRQAMWQTYNKRCSPKALPKLNNNALIKNIRVIRRKIADMRGYRSHVEYRLEDAMASSRQEIMESITTINQDNLPKLKERLQEVYEFAIDNKFEDDSLREYDVDYWAQRYKYDILIGFNEHQLKGFFPFKQVMDGIRNFFSKYMSIEMKVNTSDRFWSERVRQIEVTRKGELLGTIIYDPFNRKIARPYEMTLARVRSKVQGANHLPAYVIVTPFNPDPLTGQAHLSVTELTSLLYGFGEAVQSLLNNYPYYELNAYGAFEFDVKNMLPNLFIGHLLSDHKLLQTFSDRGGSKPIDTELASRILKATAYFRPLKTWSELYKADLDHQSHTLLSETANIATELYSKYSPFTRDPNNFDYCAMGDIWLGRNDGAKYADLWSRQLATVCLSHMQDQNGKTDDAKARELYSKLLDSLFDAKSLNTYEKLTTLVGKRFKPSETTLSVL